MRKPLLVLLLLPFLALAVAVAWKAAPLLFYGSYQPQVLPPPRFAEVAVPLAPPHPFTDAFDRGKGTLLVDLAHQNSFNLDELFPLTQRLLARGYVLELWEEAEGLAAGLRRADALAVVLPTTAFTEAQRRQVADFVAQGGKVLLIGDPTRPGETNSLAARFGLVFYPDYLYNLMENDGNFRHIFVRRFAEHQFTAGLGQLNLYTAGSITGGQGLAIADGYTLSSTRDTQGPFTPVVLAAEERVLALGDFTFLTVPHNSLGDNDRFLSRIADWLTTSQRRFSLAQFPHFFPSQVRVEIVQGKAVAEAIQLKNLLEGTGRRAEVAEYKAGAEGGRLVVGLFKDAEKAKDLLGPAGIEVVVKAEKGKEAVETTPTATPTPGATPNPTPPPAVSPIPPPTPERRGLTPVPPKEAAEEEREFLLRIKGVGEVPGEGTGLLWLDQGPQGRLLLVLVNSPEELKAVIEVLRAGEVGDWLVRPDLAVYRSSASLPSGR